MTEEFGGRASKLGNRYERYWVVTQLLLIADGELSSFKWEPLGPDGDGVEGFSTSSASTRRYTQVKISAGESGKWTISSLRSVLKSAIFHLGRDPQAHFSFVSADPAPDLRDLAERSRHCDAVTSDFNDYSLSSARLKTAFDQLMQIWSDTESQRDQSVALLSRINVEYLEKSDPGERAVTRLARRIVEGDPRLVVKFLGDFAEQHLGATIRREEIRSALRDNGFRLLDLVGDEDAIAGIETLRKHFTRSLDRLLLPGGLPPRRVTSEIFEDLRSGDSRLLIIHGEAGIGKSMVLRDLCRMLEDHHITYLPIPLDRKRPIGSIAEFSKTLGLPASPDRCLPEISAGQRSCLVLDQLDSIRWTSSHCPGAIDVVVDLIESFLSRKESCVILACRTFDLNEHPNIKSLTQYPETKSYQVPRLGDDEISCVLSHYDAELKDFSSRQLELLRVPQNLYLWGQVVARNQAAKFDTETDLLRLYWGTIRQDFEQKACRSVAEFNAVLDRIVLDMDENSSQTCALRIVDHWPLVHKFMLSSGVIRPIGQDRIAFSHQTLLDHLVAERLPKQIQAARKSVCQWFETGDQSLFRREQVRRLLAILRDEQHTKYVQSLRDFLASDSIRFHLKHLVLRHLSEVHIPSDSEVDLVLELLGDPDWKSHVFSIVLWRNPTWYVAISDRGIIDKWLLSGDAELKRTTINLSRHQPRQLDEMILPRLVAAYESGGDATDHVVQLAWIPSVHELGDSEFEFRLRMFRDGHNVFHHLLLDQVAAHVPLRMLKIIEVLLLAEREWVNDPTERRSPLQDADIHFRRDQLSPRAIADSSPMKAWKVATKGLYLLRRIRRRLRRANVKDSKVARWYDLEFSQRSTYRNLQSLLVGIAVAAGVSLLRRWPIHAPNLIGRVEKLGGNLERYLKVSILAHAPECLSDLAATTLVDDTGCFTCGPPGRRTEPAEKLLLKHASTVSASVLISLQQRIKAYRDSEAIEAFKWQLRHKGALEYAPNWIGYTQFRMLKSIGRQRLHFDSLVQLNSLERKFEVLKEGRSTTRAARLANVVSPIPSNSVHLVSDGEWVRIASRNWNPRHWIESATGDRIEHSHEQFARTFGRAATWEPSRFCRISLSLTPSECPGYFIELLQAIGRRAKAEDIPDELSGGWACATDEEVFDVLRHIGYSECAVLARQFCRTVASIELGEVVEIPRDIFALLEKYATVHPDPEERSPRFTTRGGGTSEEEVENLGTGVLNCTRALAFLGVRRLLALDNSLIPKAQPTVERGLLDSSWPVRIGAICVLRFIAVDDLQFAVSLFESSVADMPDAGLATREVTTFLNATVFRDVRRLSRTITRMIGSENELVSGIGAEYVALGYLKLGEFRDLWEQCRCGTESQRRGIAKMLSSNFDSIVQSAELCDAACQLFDDSSEVVRRQALMILPHKGFNSNDLGYRILDEFIKSTSFAEHGEEFAFCVDESARLKDFSVQILEACRRALELTTSGGDRVGLLVYQLPKIVLRLYEETKDSSNSETHEMCLDMWDCLLKVGAGDTQKFVEAL